MKNLAKKMLASLVAVCMMLAMFPAIPAQTAEAVFNADGNLAYVFNGSVVSGDYVEGTNTSLNASKTYNYAHLNETAACFGDELPTAASTNAGGKIGLSKYAKDNLTYDDTRSESSKRSAWKATSSYVSTVTYKPANTPDKFSASPTWVRMFGGYGIGFHVYGNVANRRAELTITLKVEEGEEGWYDIKTSYSFPTNSTGNTILTCTMFDGAASEGVVKGKVFSTSTKAASWKDGDCGRAYFAPGEYDFTIQFKTPGNGTASSSNFAYVRNVKLVPVVVENADVFGKCGAYIQKTEGGYYKATFLSGIDSLEYEEVGFVVKAPAAGLDREFATTSVYKNIKVEDQPNVNAASFGMADSAYVYYTELNMNIPASITEATFQPYAKKTDGTYIYGKTYTAKYVAQ